MRNAGDMNAVKNMEAYKEMLREEEAGVMKLLVSV